METLSDKDMKQRIKNEQEELIVTLQKQYENWVADNSGKAINSDVIKLILRKMSCQSDYLIIQYMINFEIDNDDLQCFLEFEKETISRQLDIVNSRIRSLINQ